MDKRKNVSSLVLLNMKSIIMAQDFAENCWNELEKFESSFSLYFWKNHLYLKFINWLKKEQNFSFRQFNIGNIFSLTKFPLKNMNNLRYVLEISTGFCFITLKMDQCLLWENESTFRFVKFEIQKNWKSHFLLWHSACFKTDE